MYVAHCASVFIHMYGGSSSITIWHGDFLSSFRLSLLFPQEMLSPYRTPMYSVRKLQFELSCRVQELLLSCLIIFQVAFFYRLRLFLFTSDP